jgi:type II secretory pathway component PulF
MAFKLDNTPGTTTRSTGTGERLEKLLKTEITIFGSGFTNKKKQSLYHELGVLLKAGITIREAVTLIIESLKKEADKDLLNGVLKQVINGKPFSEALYQTKKFSEYEYYSLKIGEETGTTAEVCRQLGIFYERKNEQQRIVIAALTYPCIVLTTAILVVIFMLSYVVPMFQDIFKQNKMELPTITMFIVSLSNFVRSYGLFFFLILAVLIVLSRLLKDKYVYRKTLHYMLLQIPVFGKFISKVYLAQFTQAVSLLTTSKVPMLNSIQLVKKMIRFVPLQEALQKVEDNILTGKSLSKSMAANMLFDARIIALVKVAEETNQTEYVFNQLNEQFNQEVTQQSKIMSTVLEPFIILFVGVIVAILLIAMYLPMFQLSSAIG